MEGGSAGGGRDCGGKLWGLGGVRGWEGMWIVKGTEASVIEEC